MEGRGVKEVDWCSWRRKEEKPKVERKNKKNYIKNLPRTT
jgi:hypothetical protein